MNLGRSGHYWVRRGRQPLLPLRRHNRYRRGSATGARAQDVSDDRSFNQQSIADRMRIDALVSMPRPSRSTPYSAVPLSVSSTTSGCSKSVQSWAPSWRLRVSAGRRACSSRVEGLLSSARRGGRDVPPIDMALGGESRTGCKPETSGPYCRFAIARGFRSNPMNRAGRAVPNPAWSRA